jgi:integrase/recombinase XerC/integrase/recombinase XerD
LQLLPQQKISKGKASKMNTTKSLTQLAEEFLQQHDIEKVSSRQYMSNLKQFIQWLRDNNRSERSLSKIDIIAFKRDMQQAGRSASTVASYLTTFRVFFGYLHDIGLIADVMHGVKYPKRDKTFKKLPLTDSQVNRLMKIIPIDTIIGLRDYAMINLMLLTGLRTVEVSRIRIKDVIEKYDKQMMKVRSKGDFDYNSEVDLNDDAWQPINDYLVKRSDFNEDDYMFVSHSNRNRNQPICPRRIGMIVADYFKQSNIKSKYYTAHSLRHTAAMKYLEVHQEDYEKLRIFMRHNSPATTQVYTHMFREKIKMSDNQYQIANAYPHLKRKTEAINI